MSTDYELCKKYLIRNIEVTSEVVKDEEREVDGRQWRALVIRSSCESSRWGIRNQDHSYSCQVPFEDFASSLEAARAQAAEVLAATELGEISEKGVPLILVEIVGPTGERMTPACGVDLGVSPTLLSPEFITLLRLDQSGEFHCEVVNGSPRLMPLYTGRIRFGTYDVQAKFLPATYNGPVILGGDFFQKALQGKEYVIRELIMPDHFRTLMNAARCKKKYVLVLGKYGDQRERLHRIKQALADKMLTGLILDEYPDIEEQSLTEKR